jgi:hypothetical protein
VRQGTATLALLLLAAAGAVGSAASAQAAAPNPHVDASARFDFWSDPRVNLHHFLYQWANADLTDGGLRPVQVAERDDLATLSEEERGEWLAAVAFYRENLAERSLLFDDGMVALRDGLAGFAGVGPVGALRGELAEAVSVVERALPIYQRTWWAEHDAANRAWVTAVLPVLRVTEQDLVPRLAVALGGRWPEDAVRVDVVAYAGRVGAYTTGAPHVTVSSRDPGYAMPRSLEMLFHEASHIGSLEGSLQMAIEEAFRQRGLRAPPGLAHVAIFETAGELARRAWAARGDRAYVAYADHEGLYERNGVWATYRRALAPSWREFLGGALDRRQALLNAADALAAAR